MEKANKYNETLNLPKTEFPMRANLPQREPEILRKWEEIKLYDTVQESCKGRPKFILHDGPPYANGDIHLGHTLNKVLKDIIVKFHSLRGYDSPYVPGWDTHGLPIEQQAIKALGLNRHAADPLEFRRHCREYALKYVDIQREQFKRLGVRGDWENPYLTLSPEFEAVQIGVFGEMAKKGYIYKGLKPVYWCPSCETALAEAEIEYNEKKSASIYVKFPVSQGNNVLREDNTYFVIWTTTPWTLPANMAICLHPELEYNVLAVGEEKYVVAGELTASFLEVLGNPPHYIEKKFRGAKLEGITCRHPFYDRKSVVVLGEHVTTEQGTGCVHTAPGHGVEDFEVGKKYGLEVLSPVDDRGRFTREAGKFAGMFIEDANKAISAELKERGLLLHLGFIRHQYPHCWRCKKPVMFRATEQWFASIDGFRQQILQAIEEVRWIPAWGKDRIHNMVAERSDWCISRQRTWGVPIPIFYCKECGKEIINDDTIGHLQKLFAEHGSDVWWARPAEELIPPGLACPACGRREFRKETDIMDVWFDSGSSHFAVLEKRPELRWPADLYLEGSDQHRGWFNSSLSTSVAVRGTAPYRAVLTHGFLVDEMGRKMSKSLGNGIDPLEVIEQMGADILRLWVSSADYRTDVAASPNILKQITEAYRKVRNTCRYILGNLYDFNPEKDGVSYEQLAEIDRWALLKLHKLIKRVTDAYENYEFHVVYHSIHNFCAVDMSAIYLDIIKDRVYTAKAGSLERRSAQQTMYEIISALVRMLTPILAFTTEEIWQYLPYNKGAATVQAAGWPEYNERCVDSDLEKRWEKILEIREYAAKPLEEARQQKVIGHSLDARVQLYAAGEWYQFLKELESELPTILITSSVAVYPKGEAPAGAYSSEDIPDVAVLVQKAPGKKCERCWIYSETTGLEEAHPTLCRRCAQVMAGQN
ncbi:MAG: isoleucine--tRNA ligase [Peptococcaceae bacterium]|jgi:isoleucyl-tRNA synthetase|nr:isoleucine--tRNA ligase [Peptococcaceae bacterium]MDH7524319.1 isoleucine--tRNA ligase [Peptococcaceae bacterium]